jgi:hypothetical protein
VSLLIGGFIEAPAAPEHDYVSIDLYTTMKAVFYNSFDNTQKRVEMWKAV